MNDEHIFEGLLGKKIELVFYEDSVLHIKVDNGSVYMFRFEDDSLIIELYNYGVQ